MRYARRSVERFTAAPKRAPTERVERKASAAPTAFLSAAVSVRFFPTSTRPYVASAFSPALASIVRARSRASFAAAPTTEVVCLQVTVLPGQNVPPFVSVIACAIAANAGRCEPSARKAPLWNPPRSDSSIQWKKWSASTCGSHAASRTTVP